MSGFRILKDAFYFAWYEGRETRQ